MNCRFCGYYVSRGMKICGHCGNDPDGLKKTRLMTISKIIAVIAVIIPIITIIFNSDWKYEFFTTFGFIEKQEGDDGCGSVLDLLWIVLPFVFLFTVFAIFRTERCNFVLYLTSSLILLPLAILLFVDERDVFMCAVPCILLTISAITAKIDKQNQKIKNKKQEMKK